MDPWIWFVVAAVPAAAGGVAWLRLRARRVYVIDHVRVEMHPGSVVEDRVIEQVWRSAISMKNASRRPRPVPTFAERATVRTGWREYLASVYLDSDDVEINPGAVALAWVEYELPTDAAPGRVRLALLAHEGDPRTLRFASARATEAGKPTSSAGNRHPLFERSARDRVDSGFERSRSRRVE